MLNLNEFIADKIKSDVEKESAKAIKNRDEAIENANDFMRAIEMINKRIMDLDLSDANNIYIKEAKMSEDDTKKYSKIVSTISGVNEEKCAIDRFSIVVKNSAKMLPKYGYFDEFSDTHNIVAEIINDIIDCSTPEERFERFNDARSTTPIMIDVSVEESIKQLIKYVPFTDIHRLCAGKLYSNNRPIVLSVKIYLKVCSNKANADNPDIIMDIVTCGPIPTPIDTSSKKSEKVKLDTNRCRDCADINIDDIINALFN